MDHSRGTERFRKSIGNESDLFCVAEDGVEIIGFLALGSCRDPDIDQSSTGEVYAMYLLPEYWRKGIGRAMSHMADRLLKDRGYSRAVLWVFKDNTKARMFYEAMGFVADGATKVLDMGAPLNAVRYCKAL
jgi:ribosomal protein S18 acetylase RimI-like enzyme